MATCVERLQVYETFHVTDDTSNPITTWPSRLDSPLSWAGADFSDEKVYTYFLSTIEIAEVTSALRHFQGEDHPNNFDMYADDQQILK